MRTGSTYGVVRGMGPKVFGYAPAVPFTAAPLNETGLSADWKEKLTWRQIETDKNEQFELQWKDRPLVVQLPWMLCNFKKVVKFNKAANGDKKRKSGGSLINVLLSLRPVVLNQFADEQMHKAEAFIQELVKIIQGTFPELPAPEGKEGYAVSLNVAVHDDPRTEVFEVIKPEAVCVTEHMALLHQVKHKEIGESQLMAPAVSFRVAKVPDKGTFLNLSAAQLLWIPHPEQLPVVPDVKLEKARHKFAFDLGATHTKKPREKAPDGEVRGAPPANPAWLSMECLAWQRPLWVMTPSPGVQKKVRKPKKPKVAVPEAVEEGDEESEDDVDPPRSVDPEVYPETA